MSEQRERTYPVWMYHPSFQPATISAPGRARPGELRPDNGPARPIQYPPVMVRNQNEEEYHAAQGYVTEAMNPAAFNRMNVARLPIPTSEPETPKGPQLYPKYIGLDTPECPYELVKTEAEERAFRNKYGFYEEQEKPAAVVAAIPEISEAEWAEFQAWKAKKTWDENEATPEKRAERDLRLAVESAISARARAAAVKVAPKRRQRARMSEEQREALRERLKLAREAKVRKREQEQSNGG